MGLRLLGGVWKKDKRLVMNFRVDRADALGIGDEQVVDDRVGRHRAELPHDRISADAGLLRGSHIRREQPGLGDHVPADLVLHMAGHVLGERGHSGEHAGDPVASRPGLLQDGTAGYERLEERADSDRGQHECGGHEGDPGSK